MTTMLGYVAKPCPGTNFLVLSQLSDTSIYTFKHAAQMYDMIQVTLSPYESFRLHLLTSR